MILFAGLPLIIAGLANSVPHSGHLRSPAVVSSTMRSIKHFTNEPLPPCILQVGVVSMYSCDIDTTDDLKKKVRYCLVGNRCTDKLYAPSCICTAVLDIWHSRPSLSCLVLSSWAELEQCKTCKWPQLRRQTWFKFTSTQVCILPCLPVQSSAEIAGQGIVQRVPRKLRFCIKWSCSKRRRSALQTVAAV